MKEFEFLKYLKNHFNLSYLGDDCAVLPFDSEHDLLATADMLVEGTDFDLDWAEPGEVGHKSLAVSLSDIAAMGGEPLWSMISIAVPDHLFEQGFLTAFYDGISGLAREYGVTIAGGDVSGGVEEMVIDSIVLGRCPSGEAITRGGAVAGNLICVSGYLGAAAAGLRILTEAADLESINAAREALAASKQLKPTPQLTLSNQLRTQCLPTAMIDLSDGLSSDLRHICEASGVGAAIYSEKIPIDPLVYEFGSHDENNGSVPLEMALNGGEDLELLFTIKPSDLEIVTALGCTIIGEILRDPTKFLIVSEGSKRPLTPSGFEHFRISQ